MQTGVIYARYSCDKQTENSILGQVRECNLFAERNDIKVIDVYKDEAISGKTALKRPAFMRMIRDAALGKFKCVIVWKGDRFARNRVDSAKYKSELRHMGVQVLSATEANVTGAEAVLMDGINEAFAEFYIVELAEKVCRGMTQNVIEGKWNGGIMPLGYKLDENRNVVIDENKAYIIRELFERYVNETITMSGLAKSFKAKGYTNNKGKYIPQPTVQSMLKNEKYYGRYEFHGTVNMNVFPAIISKELFDAAQVKMAANEINKQRLTAKDPFLLADKVYCAYDGHKLFRDGGTSRTGRTYYYYVCPKNNEHPFNQVRYNKHQLEDIVFTEFFNKYWCNKKTQQIIIDKLLERFRYVRKPVGPLKEELDKTNKKLQNIINAIENGADVSMLVDRMKELQKLKDDQEKQYKDAVLFSEQDFETSMKEFLSYYFDAHKQNEEIRRWIVDKFINKIYLSEDEIVIMFKYTDNPKSDYLCVGYNMVHKCNDSAHQTGQSHEPIYVDDMLVGIMVSINK